MTVEHSAYLLGTAEAWLGVVAYEAAAQRAEGQRRGMLWSLDDVEGSYPRKHRSRKNLRRKGRDWQQGWKC